MPPPGAKIQPLATVRFAIETVGLPASPKTRPEGAVAADTLPRPLTVRALTPGPLIVRLPVMDSWPLVRVMVPVVAKSIASGPGLALAEATAARSELGPASRRLVTV